MKVLSPALKLLLAVGLLALATQLIAQSGPESKPAPKPTPQFKANLNLSDQEAMGEHWFLQRCALCHLGHYTKSDPVGYPTNMGGTNLEGVFKGASPEKEKFLREYILKGSQKMPGFQYSLETKDIDELIAYLKTL
jgi:mono/diheme cytochrome c family protein